LTELSLSKHTKAGKEYQGTINYTKRPNIIPNGRNIYQHFPLQGPSKYTQIDIFGLKINHLATLTDERGGDDKIV
jgi:hypothetical protein